MDAGIVELVPCMRILDLHVAFIRIPMPPILERPRELTPWVT